MKSNEKVLTVNQCHTLLILSFSLIFLIIIASGAGLLVPGTYFMETINWTTQSLGQDVINLFLITPLMVIATILAARKNKIALSIWGGINLYLIYTYLIYCFEIHFNRLFIVYCIILGLSFYSFLYFVFLNINKPVKNFIYKKVVVNTTAIYFLVISCFFYFLWLSKIIPTINSHAIPQDLIETGLITNPVHVIDLSIFLPGFFLTGILLLRKISLGFLLAPPLLVFSILMDITIAGLIIGMRKAGIETNYTIAIAMGSLACFGILLLIVYLKRLKSKDS